MQYLKRAIDFIKENVFGLQTKPQAHPPVGKGDGSYAQNLLSRFNLPSAREGLAAPAGDFYGLLSAALGQAGSVGRSKETQAEEMSASGILIPHNITGTAEKMTFLTAQREKLRVLLSALDMEANSLSNEENIQRDVESRMAEHGSEGLRASRSEADFDRIEKDEVGGPTGRKGNGSGSWMPWAWGAKTGGEEETRS